MEDEGKPRIKRGIIGVAICVLAIILAFVIWGIVSCSTPQLSKFTLLEAGYSEDIDSFVVKIEVKVKEANYNIKSDDFALYAYGAPRGSVGFSGGNYTYRTAVIKSAGKAVLYIAFDVDEIFVDKPIKLAYKGKVVIKG